MISDAEVKLAGLRSECDDARESVCITIGASDLSTMLDWLVRHPDVPDLRRPQHFGRR